LTDVIDPFAFVEN
jgi:hypothetical protein